MTAIEIIKGKRVQTTLSMAMAVYAVLVMPDILKDYSEAYSFSNSIFSVIAFAGIFAVWQKNWINFEKRRFVISFLVGLFFSIFMVLGKNIYTTNGAYCFAVITWVQIFGINCLFTPLVDLVFRYISKVNDCKFLVPNKSRLSAKSLFFIIWALIFLAWIPPLLAAYPGVYGYDCIGQINYYRENHMYLHHPIAHTYLLGFCVVTLGEFLGSYEAGMCCYSIFQMLCLSATFSAMYSFYIAKRTPRVVGFAILALFMFLPANHLMSFAGTKDIFFAIFFALFVLILFMMVEKPELIKLPKYNILLILSSFMMIVFRNQGIYIFVATMIFSLFFFCKCKKNILIMLCAVLIISGVYNGPITKALGGIKANPLREMMSIPCVQLSRAALNNADNLTENELSMIKEYISDYEIYSYNAGISDAMKGSLDTERLKSNPMEFIKLWVKVGLKCPIDYFDAFARLTVGYWYPDMNYRDEQAYHPYWEYYPTGELVYYDPEKFLLLEQTPVKGMEWLDEYYYEITYENTYQKTPIFSMLYSSALPLWCLMLYMAYCIYEKKYRFLVPSGAIFVLMLTLLLGPVVLYRYIYPVCIVVPLMLASAINIKNKPLYSMTANHG